MKSNIRLILLACGLIVSLLFLFLSGEIYQSLPLGNPLFTEGLEDFRYTLRVENWGVSLALITVIMPWAFMLLYYYAIDSVSFDRWWCWLITALLCATVTSWIGFRYIAAECDALEPGLATAYHALNSLLSAWTAAISSLLFIVASYSARWWSRNCRHTPIPQ